MLGLLYATAAVDDSSASGSAAAAPGDIKIHSRAVGYACVVAIYVFVRHRRLPSVPLGQAECLLTGWVWDADCLLCVLVGAMCVVPLLGDISDGAACQGSINHDHDQLDLRHRHLALRTRAAGARANPARQPSPLQRRECRAQDALGFGLFLIFAGFCVVMAGFTAAFVPETRGVSIDAITQLWSRNVPSGKGNTLQQPLRS